MWAWAIDSVSAEMKREVAEVRRFGEEHGIDGLTEALLEGPVELAWDMSCLSCYVLQSEAVYRAPSSGRPGFSFLSLRRFRVE